jgi:hypothetical protein
MICANEWDGSEVAYIVLNNRKGVQMTNDHSDLMEFLGMQVEDSACVMDRFAGLEGSTTRGSGRQAFVFVPGSKRDRVVLVAHADTVWDGGGLIRGSKRSPILADGVVRAGSRSVGLGADDRAGCAILWQLRNSGHSLLVTSGEEFGCQGSRWLMDANSDIAEEINAGHQFMVEFDRKNGRDFKCYNVGTPEFRAYVGSMTGYTEPDFRSSTDIVTLCRTICGVNLSVGYRNEHSIGECLVLSDWQHTLDMSRKWLSSDDLPRFPLRRSEVAAS